jgi:hypothetical protein
MDENTGNAQEQQIPVGAICVASDGRTFQLVSNSPYEWAELYMLIDEPSVLLSATWTAKARSA